MYFFPQKGKGSLGAAEWCVTCTEAALIIKGIWRDNICQVELVFPGITIKRVLETISGVKGGRVTRPTDTPWHFLTLNHQFWSATRLCLLPVVVLPTWRFEQGQVLGSTNIGTTANKRQNWILFPSQSLLYSATKSWWKATPQHYSIHYLFNLSWRTKIN